MSKNLTRRNFIKVVSATGTVTSLKVIGEAPAAPTVVIQADSKPAILGGTPVRSHPFPDWPIIGENDRQAWSKVLTSGTWNRGPRVALFEETWAKMLGCRHVIATSSGTSALYTSLAALEVGPGDEVIVPPYTFIATISTVLLHHAVPVFVDSDPKTFQIDATKLEAAITDRTRCLLPVHLGGNVADMDRILEISRAHSIPVLEDACQSHLAEWRGKKVGTLGKLGCFSFQASKNLNSGEGGAICGQDDNLMAECASFHNAGRGYEVDSDGNLVPQRGAGFAYARAGDNRRMTEFQGTLLLEQLQRLEAQSRTREENAAYLTQALKEIDGIKPAQHYAGCTRNAYHLYMFRYDPEGFAGLKRSQFLKALQAEGIPCSSGYGPLNREPFLKQTLQSRAFRTIYGERYLGELIERNHCPENDRLCEEAVWLSQTRLLGDQSDMDQIVTAIKKIQNAASEIARL